MSSVAAMAKTPSAKVSRRAVLTRPPCPASSRAARSSRWSRASHVRSFGAPAEILPEHAEGRIARAEVDLRDDDLPAAAPVEPERALVVALRRQHRRPGLPGEELVLRHHAEAQDPQ